MPLHRNLFESAKFRRATFSKGKNGGFLKIGGNAFGIVYAGRLWLGAKPIRVAIKTFYTPLTDAAAQSYQRVISDLRAAGVRLPKMGIIKIPTRVHPEGEWVQVSQLFGSSKGSKIAAKSQFFISNPAGRREAIAELTKVANAGYMPCSDIVEPFKEASKGIMPLDIDQPARELYENQPSMRYLPDYKQRQADMLFNLINQSYFSSDEKRQLLELSISVASPELKTLLAKKQNQF